MKDKNYIISTFLFLFPVLFFIQAGSAQPRILKGAEEGVLFSTRLDWDDSYHYAIHYGFGMEGGYYVMKKAGKRGLISIDARLAYARKREDVNRNNLTSSSIFNRETYIAKIGNVVYDNISIALPFKYRFFPLKKVPVFVLIGFNPNFTLYNNTIFTYDEFRVDFGTIDHTLISSDQKDKITQNFYNLDLLLAGVGFKKDNMMFDLYFSGGGVDFRDDYLIYMEKLSIVLNAYYRLK